MGETIVNVIKQLLLGLEWVAETFIFGSVNIAGVEINAGMLIGSSALILIGAIGAFKLIF